MSSNPFTFRDFAKVFSLSIGLTVLFMVLFSFFPGATSFMDGLHPSVSFLVTYLIQLAILFFPLWIFVVDKYGIGFKDFGFKKISLWSILKNVSLIYFAYLVLAFVVGLAFQALGWEVPGYGQQQSYVPFFGDDAWGIGVGVLFVIIIAPFVEELYFRGFVYRTFTKTWPVWLGSILTAAVFAFVHLQPQAFIPLFMVGLFLNWSYQRGQSVWVSVAFHVLNNTIAFSADLYLYYHPKLLEQLNLASGFMLSP